jgi:multidrug efflux pump subunit AcrA (membrane-fusion protein)
MSANASSRRNSILLAAAVTIGFVVWILSGLGGDTAVENTSTNGETTAMRVTVQRSQAMATTRTIVASASTEPDRWIEIKAETEGRVVAISVERGATVAAAQTIVELDIRDRRAQLAEIEALIRQRELEYAATERLLEQQFVSEAEVAGANSLLIAARSARGAHRARYRAHEDQVAVLGPGFRSPRRNRRLRRHR